MKKILTYFILLLMGQVLIAQDTMFDVCPLKIGEEVPKVEIFDADNQAISLEKLTSDQPTVLIFYRGAWCGYCTKHLAELNDIQEEVKKLGYQMYGVTIDQAEKLEESNIKSESEIVVYSDSKATAIQAFGLDWKVTDELFQKYKTKYELDLEDWSGADHHLLPVPAVFVIKDGEVQFQYVNPNYNTRLPAKTLLAILETL